MGLLQAGILCMARCACSMNRQEVSLLVLSSLFCNMEMKEARWKPPRLLLDSVL